MDREAKAFIKVWSIIFASLSYCYFIVSKLPHGKYKLLSLIPIFTLFTILPLSLSTVLPTGITAFFITWLANFKLLLFAFNLGPLSHHQPIQSLSLLQFILIVAFPIKIKNTTTIQYDPTEKIRVEKDKMHAASSLSTHNGEMVSNVKNYSSSEITKPPPKVLPLNFWSKGVIFSILVGICDIYKGKLHHFIVFIIYCSMLYLFLDIIMGIANKLVGSIMGVDLCPPSDEPYISTSLRDFWGKRWNLMVNVTLRQTIYKPTRGFLSKLLGRDSIWAVVFAMFMAFLVSGLMHELIYYYMARVSPTWEVTWFFVLQGICVMLEVGLKDALGLKLGLHWAVSGPLTVGFVMGTGYLWFFPPLLRNQVDIRAIEEVKTLLYYIKGMF